MRVIVRAEREGDHASLVLAGPFDLIHATAITREMETAETRVSGCRSVDIDLGQLEHIDGTGAVLLASLFDRLNTRGSRTYVAEGRNPEVARLISLYREHRTGRPTPQRTATNPLARIGMSAAQLPDKAKEALDFIGHYAVALPRAVATPNSVDWRSLPQLLQQVGADALPVTSAANLLVGIIIGFLGVSQLSRFGAVAFVPELVVVAHLRELGAIITAMVVAGRSGAGLSSEIATMKVSEEIDALRSMGFDPVSWLVVPRCLALVITLPILTLIGDVLALIGGLGAAVLTTDITAHNYILATNDALTASHLLTGLVKTPFLALAIGLIACGQGLLTRGGAASVGIRTRTSVVLAIFSVIVISAIFTFFFTFMGIWPCLRQSRTSSSTIS